MLPVAVTLQGQTAESEMWGKANEAYATGNYAAAEEAYKAIERTGLVSNELFYNLGNVYYKQKAWGKAVLYYERALKLEPGDNDALYNLEMARAMTIDKIEAMPEFFLATWIKGIHGMAGADTWAWLSVLLLAACLVLAGLFFFADSIPLRKVSFFAAVLALLLSAGSFTCARYQQAALLDRSEAIIMAAVTTVKSSPDSNGKDLFILHEGTKVSLLESLGEWTRIQLMDGRQGWTLRSATEQI